MSEENHYILLSSLPQEHELRNKKLKEISAEIRNKLSKAWRNPSTWKIGNFSYNELGDVWTELNEFRIKNEQ